MFKACPVRLLHSGELAKGASRRYYILHLSIAELRRAEYQVLEVMLEVMFRKTGPSSDKSAGRVDR